VRDHVPYGTLGTAEPMADQAAVSGAAINIESQSEWSAIIGIRAYRRLGIPTDVIGICELVCAEYPLRSRLNGPAAAS